MTWLALAAGCGRQAASPEVQAPAVATASVVARDLEERIDATGELEAQLHTTLAAEVAGRVTRVVLEEGDAVVAGSTIVEIDPERHALALDEARARTVQAEARLAKERRETDRVRTLYQSRVASQSQLDGAETALALAVADATVARAQLGVARRAVADASVVAPFAGLLNHATRPGVVPPPPPGHVAPDGWTGVLASLKIVTVGEIAQLPAASMATALSS